MVFWLNDSSPIRVITLLKIFFPDYSKYELKKFIKNGKVLLNNEPLFDLDATAKENDEIKFHGEFIKLKMKNMQPTENEKLETVKHKFGNKKQWKEFSEAKNLDTDIERLSIRLHKILFKLKKTIAFAESCTGGLLSEIVTRNSGSSNYFLGGVVTYSLDSKTKILKVKKSTLKKYGAVSYQTAEEMATGLKKIFLSDISVSITGIAGPTGGTPEKPVGTVFYAIILKDLLFKKKLSLTGKREAIRKKTAIEIMKQIIKLLSEKYEEL